MAAGSASTPSWPSSARADTPDDRPPGGAAGVRGPHRCRAPRHRVRHAGSPGPRGEPELAREQADGIAVVAHDLVHRVAHELAAATAGDDRSTPHEQGHVALVGGDRLAVAAQDVGVGRLDDAGAGHLAHDPPPHPLGGLVHALRHPRCRVPGQRLHPVEAAWTRLALAELGGIGRPGRTTPTHEALVKWVGSDVGRA